MLRNDLFKIKWVKDLFYEPTVSHLRRLSIVLYPFVALATSPHVQRFRPSGASIAQ